jgi:hypothetical protein
MVNNSFFIGTRRINDLLTFLEKLSGIMGKQYSDGSMGDMNPNLALMYPSIFMVYSSGQFWWAMEHNARGPVPGWGQQLSTVLDAIVFEVCINLQKTRVLLYERGFHYREILINKEEGNRYVEIAGDKYWGKKKGLGRKFGRGKGSKTSHILSEFKFSDEDLYEYLSELGIDPSFPAGESLYIFKK